MVTLGVEEGTKGREGGKRRDRTGRGGKRRERSREHAVEATEVGTRPSVTFG